MILCHDNYSTGGDLKMKNYTSEKCVATILRAFTLSLLALLLIACSSSNDNSADTDAIAEMHNKLKGQWTSDCIASGAGGLQPYKAFHHAKDKNPTFSYGLIKYPDDSCTRGGTASNPAYEYQLQAAITTPSGLTAHPMDIPDAKIKALLVLQDDQLYFTHTLQGQDSNYPSDIAPLDMEHPYTK